MIKYQFIEEKEFMLYAAKSLSDELTIKIINEEKILTRDEAMHFSCFYWRMVDFSIEIEKSNRFPWSEGSEFWCEKIAHSIGGFIARTGYGDIWDDVANEQ